MQPYSGEIMFKDDNPNESKVNPTTKQNAFRELPPHLQGAARKALGGKKSGKINLKGKSKLARHAAKLRKRDTKSDMVNHCNDYYAELERKQRANLQPA